MLTRIPDLNLTCVDPWGLYTYSHRTTEGQERDYNITLNRLKPWIDKDKCKIIRDSSFTVHKDFKDGTLDFVYIDGAHDFDAVCLDLINWVPKVKPGGIVALHDYYKFKRSGVVDAVNGYTRCHMIKEWYTTKEVMPTAFWVKQ